MRHEGPQMRNRVDAPQVIFFRISNRRHQSVMQSHCDTLKTPIWIRNKMYILAFLDDITKDLLKATVTRYNSIYRNSQEFHFSFYRKTYFLISANFNILLVNQDGF